MKKTPLSRTMERFGSKGKLVEEIMALIKRPSNVTKEQLKQKLRAQSNKKLMVLLDREQRLKQRFGNRDKLIDAITRSRTSKKKSEDKDYSKRLGSMTTGQLLDIARRVKIPN